MIFFLSNNNLTPLNPLSVCPSVRPPESPVGPKDPSPPSQRFKTYMKVKSYTGAVVIRLHYKHDMFTYINVSHKNTAMHCIISQFHTNIKATAPY